MPTALLVQWRSSDGRNRDEGRHGVVFGFGDARSHSFDVRASDKIDTVTYR